MTKQTVIFSVLATFTIDVDVDSKDDAYDAAKDVLYSTVDMNGIEAEFHNVELIDNEETNPDRFLNHYRHCDQEWCEPADSMCNDKCPVCNREIEPYESEDL